MVPCDRQLAVRCSENDWIGRESGYADFADEHVTGASRNVNSEQRRVQAPFVRLAPYNNAETVVGCRYGDNGKLSSLGAGKLPGDVLTLSPDGMSANCNLAAQQTLRPANYNMGRSADVLTLSRHDAPANCSGVSLPAAEIGSLSSGVLSSANCDAGMQFVVPAATCDTGPLSYQRAVVPGPGGGGSRPCQLGPVDVEDLALYFAVNRIPTGCPQTIPQQQSRCGRAKAEQNAQSQNDGQRQENVPWFNPEPYCGDCQGPFSFCDEQRWLQCPASDRCPLYQNEVPFVYGANVLLPCLYENLQGEGYWPYVCAEDGQLLEEYLSNEKRKERSRDAARCRRSLETDIFTDLAAALPVPPEQAAHLDKASVMRLAIAFLKVRAVVDSGPLAKSETSEEMDELFPKALNGFMLVLSGDGNMVYLSENVSEYLGVSQMDMMGQSVYEYSHPCDHDELRECLSSKVVESDEKRMCSFFLRLKCTLTNKGRKVNLKSASYKVIHCTGRLTHIRDANSNTVKMSDEEASVDDEFVERGNGASLVLVGCPIPHPSNIEIPLGRDTFLSKHSLSMKFTYADEKLAEYLGWSSEELVGQSVFEFHHALDNLALDKSFKSLFSKGQCETVAYRFLGRKGGYAWVVTQATLIQCSKQHKPLSVVCVNYILSGVEHEDEVYSARQLAARESSNVLREEQLSTLPISVESPPPLSVQASPDSTAEVEFQPQAEPEIEDLPFAATVQQDTQILQENRARPLTVTASIFRSSNPDSKRKDRDPEEEEAKQESVKVEGGSRKDQTFPRPVPVAEKSFTGIQSLKESLEEVLKENEEPVRKRPTRKTEFIFQGKPAVEYDPEAGRRNRPQAVTRHLFTPLASVSPQPQQEQIPCRPAPQTATASIFAPRTEDMNKGFLTFSEDQPGLTMLKDEPEDLTHLAPTPGDVCVPLEDTPFLSDMLDEFILGNDNYCPLLSPGGALTPELRGTDLGESLKGSDLGDSARTKNIGDPLADSDPFMYGDSPASPCSIDPNSVSPTLTKYRQSPERSVDSLGSPTGGSGGEGLSEDEMLMLGISDSIGDDELALRAPYIPMSDQDEALELLISDDMVMWGADDKGSSKWLVDEREERGSNSSLAQLLRTDQIAQRRYNDHGGGLVNPAQVLGQIPRKNLTLDSTRWSSKSDRTERPTKRNHTPTTDSLSENKRIKCEEAASNRNISLRLEDQLLLSKDSFRRSSNMTGSQLLRRLVSQQSIPRATYVESRNDLLKNASRQPEVRGSGKRLEEEADADSGGGGSDRSGDGVFSTDNEMQIIMQNGTSSPRNPPCSSVLMNLLVSGCDDTMLDSRSVPSLLEQKDLTSPLSVELDNQMVPQCPSNGTISSLDQFSPGARKQLLTPMLSSAGSLISPSSTMMPFDNFDYDVTANSPGLLQVGTDLFGTLLERNLV